ncbi:MAG TPA: DMT family transporter [Candidatus Kapabacteria bacterium]|nr:DMT family transporter [Candidatus Kapabacteria bacterium]
MTNKSKAYFFGILTVLMWSTVATAFKISLKYFDIINMLFWSSLTSTIVFFLFIIFQKKINKFKLLKIKDLLYFSMLGLLNPFLYYLVLFAAYDRLQAQIAQPLNYSWVIVVSILAFFILKQKIKKINFVGLTISFIGIIIISVSKGEISNNLSYLGIFLAIFSSLIWGSYWVINLKKQYDDTFKLFFNFLFGTLYSILYIVISGSSISFNYQGLTSSFYIGLFEMGLTFFTWLKALQYSDNAAKIGNIIYFSPLISMFLIHWILKEEIMLTSIIGLMLIILGMLVQQIKIKASSV